MTTQQLLLEMDRLKVALIPWQNAPSSRPATAQEQATLLRHARIKTELDKRTKAGVS